MSCSSCENVGKVGPTHDQQFVDPFASGEEPRHFTCRSCGQLWWCDGTRDTGTWIKISSRENHLASLGVNTRKKIKQKRGLAWWKKARR